MTTQSDLQMLLRYREKQSSISGITSINGIGFTVAEYFAGIGLVRLGLENAGWRVVFANDFSYQKFEMYKARFPDAENHYLVSDIFDIESDHVPLTLLATSSFPCIDLSLAGNRNGIHGKHSSAFWGFINILKSQANLSPKLILVENVPGWLSSNCGADFTVTIKALNDLGYFCDVFVLDARRFTPQSRPRVFCIGVRNPPEIYHRKFLISRSESLLPFNLMKTINANSNLNWLTLPIPEPPPIRKTGLSTDVIEFFDANDPRWWSIEKVNSHLETMAPLHRQRVNLLSHQNQLSYRTFYRRMRHGIQRSEVRTDDIAGCLRTAIGGSSRQFVVAAGGGEIRMRNMTSREYARLQGVTDDYPIQVEENQALTGFGDAVCVPAITWIAENILKSFSSKSFEKWLLIMRRDVNFVEIQLSFNHLLNCFAARGLL